MRPARTCSSCGGRAYWHDTDWVCSRCGDEWQSEHDPVQFARPVELDCQAIERIARREWRCVCADDFTGWRVDAFYSFGETHSGAASLDEAEKIAARWRERGATAWHFTPYDRVEVVRVPNRNAVSRSVGCVGAIKPGDAYVEYVGEAMPYASGTRYCLACGVETWAVKS